MLVVAGLFAMDARAGETKWRWTQVTFASADSIRGTDTLYGAAVAVPKSGFYLGIDLDSAAARSATNTIDTVIIKLQYRLPGMTTWLTSTYTSGVKAIHYTDTFPMSKYFPTDTMLTAYALASEVRPMIYVGPKDQAADSLLESATAGAAALALKFWYGYWYE